MTDRSLLDLAGSVALVTGASRGVGARCAVLLARHGARVALHFNTHGDAARAVAKECEATGGPVPLLFQADLGREDDRSRLHEEVSGELGAPGLLVLNAGIYERNPMGAGDDREFLRKWRRTQEVNLEACAHLVDLSLPAMRAEHSGRIVLVSSRAAFRGETDCIDYAVSKAGQVILARSLARAEGRHGITANAVCPGWVETDMAAADLAASRPAIEAEIPLGRVATAEDVARAVLFLVSPLGAYVTGAALPLNGGSFLH